MIREILKDDLDGLLRLYMQLHNNPMPEKTAELLQIWDNIFNDKMVDYLKKALIYGHTSRISSRIYYQFTTFKGKSLDMPPGILQAPISAQY